jgi:hypothetical protein
MVEVLPPWPSAHARLVPCCELALRITHRRVGTWDADRPPGRLRPTPFPGRPRDQLFFLTVRAIAPIAGASVSHSPMVTTIDVT